MQQHAHSESRTSPQDVTRPMCCNTPERGRWSADGRARAGQQTASLLMRIAQVREENGRLRVPAHTCAQRRLACGLWFSIFLAAMGLSALALKCSSGETSAKNATHVTQQPTRDAQQLPSTQAAETTLTCTHGRSRGSIGAHAHNAAKATLARPVHTRARVTCTRATQRRQRPRARARCRRCSVDVCMCDAPKASSTSTRATQRRRHRLPCTHHGNLQTDQQ
jgi:hypothetical protein